MHRRLDGLGQQLLDASLAQDLAKAHDLAGVARQARLVARHAAEELPNHVFTPAFNDGLIAQIMGVLEIQQRDHQPDGQTRASGQTHVGAGHLERGAEQVGVFQALARASLVREQQGQGRFDLGPGYAGGQYGQGVTQVDHLIEPGAKEVVGHRSTRGRQNSRKFNCIAFETGSFLVTLRSCTPVFMRVGGVFQG